MNTRFILMFLLIALFSSCATTATENDIQKANAHYQLGMSYLNDNNMQPAFVEFQKALEFNPNDKDIHNTIGIIYLTKLQDYPKAIKHFQEALKIDKTFSEAANNLGSAYASMGKFNDAIESYKMALTNPQYKNAAMALINMGMVYYKLSKYDEAINAYKEALKRFSDIYQPYYGLALCYNAKGQYSDASAAMMRAIDLDPLYKGNKEKAIEDLKEQKLKAKGDPEKDISDYLDILKY